MNAIDAADGLARDSRGVVVTDVIVVAIGQIQDIQPKVDVVGYLSGQSKVGRQTRGSAKAVVFDQWG